MSISFFFKKLVFKKFVRSCYLKKMDDFEKINYPNKLLAYKKKR
jgi:hypothetical protein